MPQLAYSALTAVIFTSAAGALVMCLLVFRYGFAPDPDELPSAAVRRVFITRLGHALAGTCFAAVAILAAVTLADLAGVAPPAAAARAVEEPRDTESRLSALTSRLGAVESRVQRGDGRLRRIEAGPGPAAAPRRNVSRMHQPVPRQRVAAPPPSGIGEPGAVSAHVPAASPPVADARVVAPVAPKSTPSTRPAPAPADDLGSRLRRDWHAVKRAFATAGTDFRAAVEEQARTLRDN